MPQSPSHLVLLAAACLALVACNRPAHPNTSQASPEPEPRARPEPEPEPEATPRAETADPDRPADPEAEPDPEPQATPVALSPEAEARLVRLTARVRALPRREPALRDATFELCEEAGDAAAGCAAVRGVEGACLFLLQRIEARDEIEEEIAEGRRALSRMPSAQRGDEYPYLVGGYEHELVQLEQELTRLADELRDGSGAVRACGAASAADAFEVAAERLGEIARRGRS